ncbi:hypothetical protein EVAR_98762_1 [Eumeta japonica]|uniref:Uncharacterized protein n=1 Tax=Eumeta variegata TaxID=151549 RepID=A0A4C1YXH7_EUMVA|nr:hypothetical protein EVAR_98762_1 [Eumeta japonica]
MTPDNARRYPTDVYAYVQLTGQASDRISSVKSSASEGCLCHPIIVGQSAWPAVISVNGVIPLGNVASASNFKNITHQSLKPDIRNGIAPHAMFSYRTSRRRIETCIGTDSGTGTALGSGTRIVIENTTMIATKIDRKLHHYRR